MFFFTTIGIIFIIFFLFTWVRIQLPLWSILVISLFLRVFITLQFATSSNSDVYSFLTTGHVLLQGIPTYPALYFPFIFYLGALALLVGKYIAPLLFLKIVFSLFDVGVVYFVYKLSRDHYAAFLYALNPIMLVVVNTHGQMDSVPLFFLLWSMYALGRKSTVLSAVLLGITVAVKPWPLIFLPVFIKKTTKPVIWTITLGIPLLTVLIHSLITHVPILNILIPIKDYRGSYGVWGIGNIMYTLWPRFWDEAIQPFRRVFLISFGLWSFINYRKEFIGEFFLTLLTFYVFSPLFGSQWISWLVPFIFIARPAGWRIILSLMTAYITIAFATDVITPTAWFLVWRDTIVNSIGLVLWLRLCWTYRSYWKVFHKNS